MFSDLLGEGRSSLEYSSSGLSGWGSKSTEVSEPLLNPEAGEFNSSLSEGSWLDSFDSCSRKGVEQVKLFTGEILRSAMRERFDCDVFLRRLLLENIHRRVFFSFSFPAILICASICGAVVHSKKKKVSTTSIEPISSSGRGCKLRGYSNGAEQGRQNYHSSIERGISRIGL